jgi:hypothetical protein
MSEVVWMFEWGFFCPYATGPGMQPLGITDSAPRARKLMLDGLRALPDGVVATGWVAVLELGDDRMTYDALATLLGVIRDSGGVLWRADVTSTGPGQRLLPMTG